MRLSSGAAYVTAHAVKEWGVSPELGLVLGILAAAALGLVIGYLAIRRQGIYSTMITLALAQMFFSSACKPPSPMARTDCRVCRAGFSLASSTSTSR